MQELSKNELKIIEKVKIPEYHNEHISKLDKRLRDFYQGGTTTICPFHDEKDPSLHFWEKKKMFKCFGCGTSGNVIWMHMLTQSRYHKRYIDKNTAIKELAAMYGIELEEELTEEERIKNVFDRARSLISDKSLYTMNPAKINIASFREMNNKVHKANVKLSIKIANYDMLDTQISLQMEAEKNG